MANYLTDYVQRKASKGYSREEITKMLITDGHTTQAINQAFELMHKDDATIIVQHLKRGIENGQSIKTIKIKLIELGYDPGLIHKIINEINPQEKPLHQKLKSQSKQTLAYFGEKFERILLILIILMGVFDFLRILPGDIDYFKKLFSWIALGYLMYKIRLSNIFFGKANKKYDILILLGFFLLELKNFLHYSSTVHEEALFLKEFYEFIIHNQAYFQFFSLAIGLIIIVALAVYLGYNAKFEVLSIVYVFNAHSMPPKKWYQKMLRAIITYLALISFFLFIFNPIMEWMAIAIDAPLVMIAIFYFLFQRKKEGSKSKIQKVGEIGEGFLKKFIELFQRKHTIYLGIFGLISLHLVVEVGIFLIPYSTGLLSELYINQAGLNPATHVPLITLFLEQVKTVTTYELVNLVVAYAANIYFFAFSFIAPIYIWTVFYKKAKVKVPRILLATYIVSFIIFLYTRAIAIAKISNPMEMGLAGVDFITTSVSPYMIQIPVVLALFVGFLCYILSDMKFYKRLLILISTTILSSVFFIYIVNFIISVTSFYLREIDPNLRREIMPWLSTWYWSILNNFLSVIFVTFLIMNLVFYILGIVMFVKQLSLEFKHLN